MFLDQPSKVRIAADGDVFVQNRRRKLKERERHKRRAAERLCVTVGKNVRVCLHRKWRQRIDEGFHVHRRSQLSD